MANVWLLEETLRHIQTHPKEWDQGTWRCDSAMCFAGHAAILAGAKWLHPFDPHDYASTYVVKPDGRISTVRDFAASALGLGNLQAAHLFNADNTLRELKEEVAAIIRAEQEFVNV